MTRERMSSVDQAWLRMDSDRNLMMIVGVDVFEKPVKLQALQALISSRLLKFQRFRQKVVTDATGSWWVDDEDFNLDRHLVRVRLPGNGDDRQMQAFVAGKACERLDPDRPLWQFHLVEHYKGTNALVVRIHHCIADGIALIAVLMSLTDASGAEPPAPEDAASDPTHRDELSDEPNPWEDFLKPVTAGAVKAINVTGVVVEKLIQVLGEPERLEGYARMGAQVVRDAASIGLMLSDSPTRLKGVPGPRKAIAWNEPLPLDEVKLVCKALGASVNDVLLSCVAGALRNYLQGHGDDVTDCEIRAMVPVNLRPLDQAAQLGNQFGLVPLSLPVGIANPLERLVAVRRRMDELKGGYQALLAFGLLSVVGAGPRMLQTQVLDMLARKTSAVMTNVPGPTQPIRMAGITLSRMMFWVPQSGNVGVGVSILSYAGGVQFGLITDAGLCPDPQQIIDGFAVEFEKLVLTLAMLPPEDFGHAPDPVAVEQALFS